MSDFQAIADRVEIEALRGEFSDAAMMRDRPRLASLFTADGALRMPNIPAEMVGREEIRAGGERLQSQWDFFVQTTHPGVITLDGDTATGRAYIQELARTLDGRQGLNYAVYHDRYQRTAEGWKFAERMYEVRYLDTSPLAGTAPPAAGNLWHGGLEASGTREQATGSPVPSPGGMPMSARSHPRRLIVALVTGCLLVLGSLAGWSGSAAAVGMAFSPSNCVTTASAVVPGVQIADPACEFNGAAYTGPFSPIANGSGQLSQVWTGIASDGSAYRVEVPPHWNGRLVMYAHGYRGTGNEVWIDDPQLRQYFVDNGFAWAASSYATNGYDPGDGVVDTHDLLVAFPSITGLHARQAIMSGESMGGEVTTAEIEAYKGDFAGAMPVCGVLAGNNLFNYYLGANVTAAGLTGTTISYPTTLAAGEAYAPIYQSTVQTELPALGITPDPATGGQTFTTSLTKTGTLWADTVEQLSGGTRPGFSSAIDYWDSFGFAPLTQVPFLFGVYPGTNGGTLGFANGSVAGNQHTFYTFSDQALFDLPQEIALNRAVLRVPVTATSSADGLSPAELPVIHGDPGIPVLSVHGIGDLFVPLSMDQQYDAMMVAHGEGGLFVDRAIREVTHCGYTTSELSSAFSALVSWIKTGKRPAGDNILDPRAVASPTFGCRFTDPTPDAHPEFKAAVPCPASSRN